MRSSICTTLSLPGTLRQSEIHPPHVLRLPGHTRFSLLSCIHTHTTIYRIALSFHSEFNLERSADMTSYFIGRESWGRQTKSDLYCNRNKCIRPLSITKNDDCPDFLKEVRLVSYSVVNAWR